MTRGKMMMAGGFLVLAEEGKDRRAELGHVGRFTWSWKKDW
jgi:hypothetical protein